MAKFYTLNANSDVVTSDEVVPVGTGTETIATIGGKEIKAPAGGGSAQPNINVVGSPTFVAGNVSGFSANDYLVFPTEVNVGQNTVYFDIAFTTGTNVTTQQNILDSWCGLALAVKNGNMVLAASSTGAEFETADGIHQVEANTSYRYRIEFGYSDGEHAVILQVADGGGGYVMDALVRLSAPLFPTATYWGGANPRNGVHHVFGGSINLAECSISWNGRTVWSGYGSPDVVRFDPTVEDPLDTADKIVGISNSLAAYPMSDVVGGALKDRTINHSATGGTFTFPARTGTNARDFVLVIDSLAEAPTVTFPGTPPYQYFSDQDASDVWTAEAGKVNAWYFSETKDSVFMVSRKGLTAVEQ